ncbi:MAG: TolC family protein [Mariprofundaceae bacterium]
MLKFYPLPLALALLFTIPVHAAGNSQALTLASAELLALKDNSGIAASGARARALANVPPQVGSLPDPRLSLNAINLPMDTFSTTQENMTQLQLGLSQTIPFPGKLGLREEAAKFEARAAEWDAEETRLIVIRNVRLTWWNLYFLDRALSIIQRNQVLVRQFVKIAETKYKTGQGLQSDVLLAQVELSKLLDVEITLRASRRNEAAQMNALLNQPSNASVKLPEKIDETLPQAPDAEPLLKLALDTRPMLASQRNKLDASRTRVDLAEKNYYPDFTLGGAYGSRSGINPVNGRSRPDFASITFSMTLPIYTGSKQDKAVEQRQAEMIKEEFTLSDRIARVDTEIAQALADYRAGHDQASLFETGIIPQASQTVSSMLASYQVNKVDFLNLVHAQITLYNYETQYWKAVSTGWQAWARLEAAVGMEISHE